MLVTQFDKFVNRSTQEILGSEIEHENLEPMLSSDIVRNGGDVTGVKGNAEIYYRTGNVNLTPEDIGSLNVDNVYNGLDKTEAGYALDARQGKALADKLDATQSDIAIIIEGNQTTHTGGVAVGEYVIVRNSTISGITDGLYKATQAIPANTAITSAYLAAVDGGLGSEVASLKNEIDNIVVIVYEVPYDSATRLRAYNISIPAGKTLDKCVFGGIPYTSVGSKVTSAVFKAGTNSIFVNGNNFVRGESISINAFFF